MMALQPTREPMFDQTITTSLYVACFHCFKRLPFVIIFLIFIAIFDFMITCKKESIESVEVCVSRIVANAKAAVAKVVSIMIFKNPVTAMGMPGFGVTIMGVVLYNEARKRSKVTVH
ncbi:hypothetical protein Lser_V15G09833 [Lactuca serriola]